MSQGQGQQHRNQKTRSYYGKDGVQRFHVKHLESAVLEQAKQFLESHLTDLRIRQILHADKAESVCSRDTLFVLGNEQRFEPGFLVFIKGQPPLFVQGRLQYGFSLRMRVQASLYEKGSIFVGTMDTVHATLRLEDVFLYAGQLLQRSSFRDRFATLQQFFRTAFVADDRLSGCSIVCAQPMSLDNLRDIVESGQFYSVDLIPDQGGRRRWHIPLSTPAATAMQHSVVEPVIATAHIVAFTPPIPAAKTTEKRSQGMAQKVVGLPDTFDLTDEDGSLLGRAAVQTADLSLRLRKAFQGKPSGVRVGVRLAWSDEFNRYQIQDIL